jgi:hypothetical protein
VVKERIGRYEVESKLMMLTMLMTPMMLMMLMMMMMTMMMMMLVLMMLMMVQLIYFTLIRIPPKDLDQLGPIPAWPNCHRK